MFLQLCERTQVKLTPLCLRAAGVACGHQAHPLVFVAVGSGLSRGRGQGSHLVQGPGVRVMAPVPAGLTLALCSEGTGVMGHG